ncbi:MAG: caspase family protein [Hyphomicrobiaceae bacterium]
MVAWSTIDRIGNQNYTAQVGRLNNPLNDVNLIAGALRKIGFSDGDIRIVTNASRSTILRAVDDYAEDLSAAGSDAIGFFYFSGHGVANKRNRVNYLIPVGVKRLDRDVWYKAIALDRVVSTLSAIVYWPCCWKNFLLHRQSDRR